MGYDINGKCTLVYLSEKKTVIPVATFVFDMPGTFGGVADLSKKQRKLKRQMKYQGEHDRMIQREDAESNSDTSVKRVNNTRRVRFSTELEEFEPEDFDKNPRRSPRTHTAIKQTNWQRS